MIKPLKSLMVLLAVIGVFLGLLYGFVVAYILYLEFSETRNMRHLKTVFERSEHVERYSIYRFHEDIGEADVWLKSGIHLHASVSNENIRGQKWYVTNFGHYKCEEGRFDIFSFSKTLLGRPVKNWNEILDNAEIIRKQIEGRPGEKIGDCTSKLYYGRPEAPPANEWKVTGFFGKT